MTGTELWLTYQLASRAHLPLTTQLIELEFQNNKLSDLEDVLEHVFRQGYVEAKHRPHSWWERKDGQKIKASHIVEELLKQGVGKCPDNALRLVVEDVPSHLWFSYVYTNNPSAHVVTQRVKLAVPGATACGRLDRLAHVTNHIFNQGYLAPKLRPVVHWQKFCGKRIEEHVLVEEILAGGDGLYEDKPLRLVVDSKPACSHCCGCCH
ncbi:hypothetical protein BDQ12DRAFT_706876 [Crucibulum laeve]|uniref:Uncharacterized protein n=1 Tax=Crucibulum laeve TaxID=68775 RepID=A0A5C3LPI0_9AGAR|nr:hypothetical protein BDQ12DRAFT_706876 [Crucibulum laeve]